MIRTDYIVIAVLALVALVAFTFLFGSIVPSTTTASCVSDDECVVKAEAYCCSGEKQFIDSCFNVKEKPERTLTCTFTSTCPILSPAQSCKCVESKCVAN